jgi:predicted DNA-binding transcriptional regulator AlpA
MQINISESEYYKAVRAKEAASILGLSIAMVYKLLDTDRLFPKGSKLGKARVWHKGDLLTYMAKRKSR